MIYYAFLLIVVIALGGIFSLCGMSIWWIFIPAFIGGIGGSYGSRFAKPLISPNVTAQQRQKLLETVRMLTIMWAAVSAIFAAFGYAAAPFVLKAL